MKSLLITVCVLLALSGCRTASMYVVQPSGPPEYRLGWQDGCDSGFGAQGTFMEKMVFGFKKRPEMGNNELYKQAWNEGFTYCRFTAGASRPSFSDLNW
jgi:hypothetical protein